MRNVLYISMSTPYLNVPHGGGKTFYYYIKNLQDISDFHVELIAKFLDTDIDDNFTLSNVKKHFVKNMPLTIMSPVQSLFDILSKINPVCRHGNVLRDSIYQNIKKECRNLEVVPDVVILEFSWMVLMVKEIKKIFPEALIIASEHDVSYLGMKRFYITEKNLIKKVWNYISYINIKKRELKSLSLCDIVMPHNIKDKELLVNDGILEKKIWVLTPYFQNSEISRNPDFKTIIFYGAMNRFENEEAAIWFIENVMNLLQNTEAQFVVVGNLPSERMKSYETSHIHVTGFVEDIAPYLEKCMCAVIPLIHGAGIKIKTLEFLAMGVPVLSNKIGIEGIPAINGRDYIHCEDATEYADVIKTMMNCSMDINKLSTNAKNFMNNNFNLEESFKQYKKIILQD